MHAMHAVDTQSWGELVESARTVVFCWVGMFSTSTWAYTWHVLCRDVQVMTWVMRTHSAGSWGADAGRG